RVDSGSGGEAFAVRLHAFALVVGEDAQVQRLVWALADPALAGRERHLGAGQAEADQVADRATSRAWRNSSWRPASSPSSFLRSVSSSAYPSAGDSGTPASTRSLPVISS